MLSTSFYLSRKGGCTFQAIFNLNAKGKLIGEFKMRDNGTILHVGMWLILGTSSIENHVPWMSYAPPSQQSKISKEENWLQYNK